LVFRKLRLILLLFILFVVGMDTYLTKIRTTDWDRPLYVLIHPINGDGSETSREYIQGLGLENFEDVEQFFKDEAERYKLSLAQPVKVILAPPLQVFPPPPPKDRQVLKIMLWSLKLRYWSATVDSAYAGPPEDVNIYVKYFDPDSFSTLEHSLGLEKGLIGVVNAYASTRMDATNNVVIAHEFLHTVGASDKYDLSSGQPLFPDGYADPERQPRHPQEYAEIMGGKVPISDHESKIPESLYSALVGNKTAREINWLQ